MLQSTPFNWRYGDLFGKGSHVRMCAQSGARLGNVDERVNFARIEEGLIFRCVTHSGTVWGSGSSEEQNRAGCSAAQAVSASPAASFWSAIRPRGALSENPP